MGVGVAAAVAAQRERANVALRDHQAAGVAGVAGVGRSLGGAQRRAVIALVVCGLAACAAEDSFAGRGTPRAGTDIIRLHYTMVDHAGEAGANKLEVFADNVGRVRVTVVDSNSGHEGSLSIWDGRRLLMFDTQHSPPWQQRDDVPAPPAFVFAEGSESFPRFCVNARETGTDTVLHRTAVRYICEEGDSEEESWSPAHKVWLDQDTGALLNDQGLTDEFSTVATDIELDVKSEPGLFSTKVPEGAKTHVDLQPFKLPGVDGIDISSAAYAGGHLVLVAGDAEGVRATVRRLTAVDENLRVLALLEAEVPLGWEGSLLNDEDVESLARVTARSAGGFRSRSGLTSRGRCATSSPMPGVRSRPGDRDRLHQLGRRDRRCHDRRRDRCRDRRRHRSADLTLETES